MKPLSNVKLLHTEDQKIDFSSIDEVIQEIVHKRRPKGKSVVRENTAADKGETPSADEIGMDTASGLDSNRIQAVCMPYTSDDRLQVVLTALEFVQKRDLRGEGIIVPETQSQGTDKTLDDRFDAEIMQMNKLATLTNWRRELMDRLEMNATESESHVQDEEREVECFDATGDLALELELKEILEKHYDNNLRESHVLS